MTQTTQGGVARYSLDVMKTFAGLYAVWFLTKGQKYSNAMSKDFDVNVDLMEKFMEEEQPLVDESPLPASPEGTWETEFEKLYAKKNYYNLVSFVQSIFQPLQQELSEHKRAIELISSQYQYRVRENERLNKVLSESIQTGEKAIERIGELEKQLAEAREALEFERKHRQIAEDSLLKLSNKFLGLKEENDESSEAIQDLRMANENYSKLLKLIRGTYPKEIARLEEVLGEIVDEDSPPPPSNNNVK